MGRFIDDTDKRIIMVTFFEQDRIPFLPFSHTKATSDLISGIFNARSRFILRSKQLGKDITVSETLIDADMTGASDDTAYTTGGEFLFAVTDKPLASLPQQEFTGFFIRAAHPWDFIDCNGEMINRDFELFMDTYEQDGISAELNGVTVIGDIHKVFIHKEAVVLPGVVIDTTEGIVVVDRKAKIKPFSYIEGPSYIGVSSLIDGAKIRPATHIGAVCKIAGEIENSIFHSYSNKHHDGFIGHSYVGSWVNLGAMTTNSDLKNNYGGVTVQPDPFSTVFTGSMRVGCFIGDHVKTGIGTLLNTGAVVGAGSCLFGGGMFPKHVPAFSWASSSVWDEYAIDKCIENETVVMKRGGITPDPVYAEKLRSVFNTTRNDREEGKKAWQH